MHSTMLSFGDQNISSCNELKFGLRRAPYCLVHHGQICKLCMDSDRSELGNQCDPQRKAFCTESYCLHKKLKQ